MEIWRDIEGYEGLYQVSNEGRIKDLNYRGKGKEVILKGTNQTNGQTNYKRTVVRLCKDGTGKDYKLHFLVAKTFIPNPNNYKCINHIDGNPLNNNVNNLEWTTQKKNVAHAIDHNLIIHRIKTIDRETMIELLNNGFNYDEIAKELGIAKGTVHNYIKKFNIKKIYV